MTSARTPRERNPKRSDVEVPALGPVGMLRWAWRQLTKMSTALVLLLLLAIAAVPGSLFPQRVQDPDAVTSYIQANPTMGPWLDRLQLFDVYSSYWFSSIYILLFISLVGCVIPRAVQHFRAWRSKPPRAPRRISRMPQDRKVMLGGRDGAPGPTPDEAVEQAAAALKKRGYRVAPQDLGTAAPSVAAERGMLKEVGNILFHVALLAVLISVAIGSLYGYKGQKVVVEGESFVNTLVDYDSFNPGTNFDADWLNPFSVRLNNFQATFNRDLPDPQGARRRSGPAGLRGPPAAHGGLPGGSDPQVRGPGAEQPGADPLLVLRGPGPGQRPAAERVRAGHPEAHRAQLHDLGERAHHAGRPTARAAWSSWTSSATWAWTCTATPGGSRRSSPSWWRSRG